MRFLLNVINNNWRAISLVLLTIITTLSLLPLEQLPPVSGSDKLHHFIAYSALMFPTALRKPEKWLFIGLFFISFSGVIELLQPYVNRHNDWLDLACNAAGIVCGWVIAELLTRFNPQRV